MITTHPLRDCTCNQRDLPINRHQPTRLPLSINYYYFYPCPAPVPAPSQKPSQGDISGTKRGVIAVCDEKPISILETGTRISFFQSHVRDENENFFLLFLSLMFKCTVNRTFDRANPDYGNTRCQFLLRVHRTLFWSN